MEIEAKSIIAFILEYQEEILLLLGALLTIVRATSWGKANREALKAVTEAIEQINHPEVKKAVRIRHERLPSRSKKVLENIVYTVDEKKQTPGLTTKLKELL